MIPLISVITVTYNAAGTLPATLASVRSQDFSDFEWLVIDGASTDGTQNLVISSQRRNETLLSESDRGLYDAMNKGLMLAKGRYVLFLNAGDRFHCSNTLSQIASAIRENDFPGVVYGQTDIVNSAGERVADRHLQAPEILTYKSFAEGMVVCHQAFVARKDIVGKFDLQYRFSADYNWCICVLKRSGKNVYIPAVLIDYLAEGVTTKNRRASLTERFRIMSHHYGLWPTIFRHLKFLPRFLRRRRLEKEFISNS